LDVEQQPVVDRLTGVELDIGLVARGEHARMTAVPAVVVGDIGEVAHPPVDAEQVERGGTDEIDRRLIRSEEMSDLGDIAQMTLYLPTVGLIGGIGGVGGVRHFELRRGRIPSPLPPGARWGCGGGIVLLRTTPRQM